MAELMTPGQIESYWKTQAAEHGPAPTASWSDTPVIELEIRIARGSKTETASWTWAVPTVTPAWPWQASGEFPSAAWTISQRWSSRPARCRS